MNQQVFIAPGELRHSVQIQSQSAVVDALGGQSSSGWQTVRNAMASIVTAGQKDAYQAQQRSAQVTHVITVRWTPTPALLPGMQVLFTEVNGTLHTYLVDDVDNVLLRNVKIRLMCLEINGGQ